MPLIAMTQNVSSTRFASNEPRLTLFSAAATENTLAEAAVELDRDDEQGDEPAQDQQHPLDHVQPDHRLHPAHEGQDGHHQTEDHDHRHDADARQAGDR